MLMRQYMLETHRGVHYARAQNLVRRVTAGYDDGKGLPIGLMLVGKHWDESTIYRAAQPLSRRAPNAPARCDGLALGPPPDLSGDILTATSARSGRRHLRQAVGRRRLDRC